MRSFPSLNQVNANRDELITQIHIAISALNISNGFLIWPKDEKVFDRQIYFIFTRADCIFIVFRRTTEIAHLKPTVRLVYVWNGENINRVSPHKKCRTIRNDYSTQIHTNCYGNGKIQIFQFSFW